MNSFAEMWRHPQVRHRGLIAEVAGQGARLGSPFRFATPEHTSAAPALGAHTRQMLRQAGLSEEEIAELEGKGVVKTG